MNSTVEVITPEKASAYLENNTKNRSMRRNVVQQYAKDMKAGKWELTHQGIAFNCDGTLLDGQHRLQAVVESGVPVPMMVTRGVSSKSQIVMDDHAKRSAGDAIGLVKGFQLTSRSMAIIRSVVEHSANVKTGGRQTRQELCGVVEHFCGPLQFLRECFQKNERGISSAPVQGAICIAWFYVQDLDRLRLFCDVLCGRKMADGPQDRAAIVLREFLLRHGGINKGGSLRSELYKKTQRSIVAFMERKELTKLYSSETYFRWPLIDPVR